MTDRYPTLISSAIAAVFLLAATFGHWPYGFYQILRWAVCLCACWSAWLAFAQLREHGRERFRVAGVIFIGLAVLFNPLAPLRFGREVWVWLDGGAAVLFAAGVLLVSMPTAGGKS